MEMNVELRQLEHFVAAAEERHFTRAARRLHIVQSGLSASIRALERELGAPLFVRSTRRVELTPAGRALLPEARRALAAAAAGARPRPAGQRPPAGRLRPDPPPGRPPPPGPGRPGRGAVRRLPAGLGPAHAPGPPAGRGRAR